MVRTLTARRARLLRDERGVALIIALMTSMLLTALGVALIMVTNTETQITANFRNGQEALYAADAGVERVVQDLLLAPRWDDILTGTLTSGFVDGTMAPTLPGGGIQIDLTTATAQLQAETDAQNVWGANNPVWRLYAWSPVTSLLPTGTIDSSMYIAVWIADDPSEIDGDPLSDTNGVLTLHSEAFGSGGTRKVVEVTVARTSGTEIERGQIAQRGQEELNQRARKAAVETPGRGMTASRMGLSTGNMVVQ
jgi:hypothetical protein